MMFLPHSLRQLQNLHTLVLVCERLSSLPDSFVQLNNLIVLALRGCATLTFLPENFGELRSLECMEAGCENLTCLPEFFGLLKRLRTLELFSDTMASFLDTFRLLISLHFVDFKCPKLKHAPASVDCLPIWVQKKLASDLDGTQVRDLSCFTPYFFYFFYFFCVNPCSVGYVLCSTQCSIYA